MIRILVVDTGNYCRSPVVEGYVRKLAAERGLRVTAASAGFIDKHVGGPADPRTIESAKGRGVDLSRHVCRKSGPEDFRAFDYILAVDPENLERARGLAPPDVTAKLGLIADFAPALGRADIPDPYYGGADGFALVLDMAERAADGVLTALDTAAEAARRTG